MDALIVVAGSIEKLKRWGCGILVITHYQRILKFLSVDKVHILVNGRVVTSNVVSLVTEVERNGYKKWNIKY